MITTAGNIGTNDDAEKFQFDGIVPDTRNGNTKRVIYEDDTADEDSGWFYWFPRWRPVSRKTLQECERTMLSSTISTAYNSYFVNIGPVVGNDECRIWTVSLNEESTEVPLVLVHGFAAANAFWCLNLGILAESRPVYAIDLLGFGRSSRPTFSSVPEEAEHQFVDSIEAWRKSMELKSIILLGHSFGGYLSTSFAIRYPEVVEHLILADPWGFKERPLAIRRKDGKEISIFIRVLLRLVERMNPLSSIRLMGPWGPNFIRLIRSDIIARFEPYVKDAHNTVGNYLYQCNALNPSGESAFHSMMSTFFWAKNPMQDRFHCLEDVLPVTLIFGSRSWVEKFDPENFESKRGSGYLKSHVIDGTHHLYADQKDEFNRIVDDACRKLKRQV